MKPVKTINAIRDSIEPWYKFAAIVIGVVSALYAATIWVQNTAQKAVLNEKFLATLATQVRPTCIFDSRGAIEADLGASEYIEEILVRPAGPIYGYEVLIKAKRHLVYAPLITGLDTDMLPQSATRGKMYDWDIVLFPKSTMSALITETPMDTNALHRFKLEILH